MLNIGENYTIKNSIFWFEGDGGEISIGNGVTIEGAHIAVVDNHRISLGNDCMLSKDITISTTDSHSIVDINGIRINHDADVVINDHVWIDQRVIIGKGVTIGKNSLVGASSIVTRNIEENNVAAGVPAKIVKRDIKTGCANV